MMPIEQYRTRQRRPLVGLDVDGVVADFLTPALAIIQRLLGRTVERHDVVDWHVDRMLHRDQRPAFWEEIGTLDFCRAILPYRGVEEHVARLDGVVDLRFVTSYMPSNLHWVQQRDLWIERHFNLPRERIVYCADKSCFGGEMLVDDRPENLVEWSMRWTGIPVLWRHPYNRDHRFHAELARRIITTDDWEQVHLMAHHLTRSPGGNRCPT